jgi:thiol-disulfide isomerase/thioredoxin
MKFNSLFALTTGLVASALLSRAAEEATLKAGAVAPALKTSSWVKGEGVKEFKPGTVYVVEFWATWCGPCKTTIPHLTEVAKKHKGKVEVIGMDIWEREKDQAKLKPLVVKFVEEMGEKMVYHVGMDTEDAYMASEWMKAAGRNGIPSAFVVDKTGKIAWMGHPMDGMDEVIEQVLAGTFDLKAAAAAQEKKQAAQMKDQETMRKISTLRREGKAAEALAEFDAAAKDNAEFAKRNAMMRVQLLMDTDPAAGEKAILALSEGEYKDNPRGLVSLARMAGSPQSKQPNYDLALRLGERAQQVSPKPDPMIFMSLAEIHNAKGDTTKAVAAMKECIALAEKEQGIPPQFLEQLKSRLERMQAGK